MTGSPLDFRQMRFTSPESMDKRWFEWFREEFCRRMFQGDMEAKSDAPFWLDANIRLLPDLAIFTGGASPMRWKTDSSEESFNLTTPVTGQLLFRSPGTDILLEPGAAIVGSLADTLELNTDTRFISIRLSPRLLAPLVPNFADIPVVALPANTQALRLLTCYLHTLGAEEAIETPEAGHLVAQHIHDLAALALGTSRDAMVVAQERGGRAARLVAIKQDILSHLADPDLSVASLAARQGLGPRYIHMLFERSGATYSEFVVAERLIRAHRMLTDPRTSAYPIGAIALKVGFGDLSYFNRCFRRKYGGTPSEVRAMARMRQ